MSGRNDQPSVAFVTAAARDIIQFVIGNLAALRVQHLKICLCAFIGHFSAVCLGKSLQFFDGLCLFAFASSSLFVSITKPSFSSIVLFIYLYDQIYKIANTFSVLSDHFILTRIL